MAQKRRATGLDIGTWVIYWLGFLLWVVIWALLALATIALLETPVAAALV